MKTMKNMKIKKNKKKHNKKTKKNVSNKKRRNRRKKHTLKKMKRGMKNSSRRGGGGCDKSNRRTRKKNHAGGAVGLLAKLRMRPRMPDISIKGKLLSYLFDLRRGFLSHPELNKRNMFAHIIINVNYLKGKFFKVRKVHKYRSIRPRDLVRYVKKETNENLIIIEKQVIEVLKHPLYIKKIKKQLKNYVAKFNNKSEEDVKLLGILLMIWMNHMTSKFDENFLKPINEIEIKPNSEEDYGMYNIKKLNNNQVRLLNALISHVILSYGIGTSSYAASKEICTMNKLKDINKQRLRIAQSREGSEFNNNTVI